MEWAEVDDRRPPTPTKRRPAAEESGRARAKAAIARTGKGDSERASTSPRSINVTYDYVAWLQETWVGTPPIRRSAVLDPMAGVWSGRARRYLQAVFPHSFFSSIHDAPGDGLGCLTPDCCGADSLDDLSMAVEHDRAYVGIALDGNGDGVTFVDDDGSVLTAEETTWILLQSFAEGLAGEKVVCDWAFSDRIGEAVRQLGAEVIVENGGEAALRNCMLDCGAVFGADTSGHYFFRDLKGGDDGLFAACRLIDFLARSGESLAHWRRACPPVFVTPDLRVGVKARAHRDVLQRVREKFAKYPQTEADGVRVQFPDGWALVRRSWTEPAILFRFEGADWASLADMVHRVSEALPGVSEALWCRYDEAMGLPAE